MADEATQIECENLPCYVVTYKASDPKAETFSNTSGDTRTYPMPTPGDGIYNLPSFKAVRDAFDKEAQKDMKKWDPVSKGCCEDCYCVPSTDPKNIVSSSTRYPFSMTYTYPDGGTAIINGSYQLDIQRAEGTCIPLPDWVRALIALLRRREHKESGHKKKE